MGRRNANKDPLNHALALFMRDTRVKAGIKQSDVAKSLSLSREYYSQLENGIYKLPLTDFVRFSKKYAPHIYSKLPKEFKKYILSDIGTFLAIISAICSNEQPPSTEPSTPFAFPTT